MAKLQLTKEERNKLIVDHLWIVDYLAHKFSDGKNIALEDLRSVGGIGLVKAADNYEDNMGTSFSTYATLIVQGEIRHYLRDRADILRIPRKYVDNYKIIQETIQESLNQTKQAPSLEEIHLKTGLEKKEIVESLEAAHAKFPLSLDEPLNQDGEKLKVYDTVPTQGDDPATMIQRITINTALQKLEPTERKSIVLKYQYDLTYEEIAEKLGLKTGKVVRSIQTGLKKLKKYLIEGE
ncbi:MAG TPA: sigma-70 family RNA polymerase sigma factor [Caldisericia bacterium]|nr:sigma-70 family RNA polymerase sigma factor [Caldisericia bacterium]